MLRRTEPATIDRLTRHRDGPAQHGRGTHGGVVDDPVQHHLRGFRLDGNRIGGDFGNLGGQVFIAGEFVGAAPSPHRMHQHNSHTRTLAPVSTARRIHFNALLPDPRSV